MIAVKLQIARRCCFLADFGALNSRLARRLLYTHSDYAARYRLSQFLQTVAKFVRNLEEFP
jgi:hypothetical protein